jgi:MFS family permease
MPTLLERAHAAHRGLPAAYWTVWVGTLINKSGTFVFPLLTFYLTRERGLSLAAAGAIVSLYGLGALAASLVGGVLADRLGRRATMALSMFGGAAVMLALSGARTPAALAALTLALGLTADLYRPAVSAFVADVVPPEDRARAYGYLYWAVNVGFAAAPALGGLLAGWSYTALFVGDAVTMAAYGALVLARVPETRPATPPAGQPRTRLADVLRDRGFMVFWGLSAALALVFFQHNVTLPGQMAAQGHGAQAFGAVLSLNGLVIVVGQPLVMAAVTRRDPSRVLAAAALLTGLGFALHGLVVSAALHAVAVAVWTAGELLSAPTSSAVIAALAPVDARGRYQGVYAASWGVASFAGPLGGPALLAAAGPAAAWGGCAALGALVAAGFVLTGPARRARLTRGAA